MRPPCDVERDGQLGLQRAATEVYDLIVLDIMLPTLNGFKICGALRDQNLWTPILMLTAKSGEWDEAERHAGELEAFLSEEPLVWSDFMIARARALVAHGRGKRDAATRAEFERLIKDGERYGYRASLPMMQLALADVAAAMDREPSGDVLAWGSPWLLDHPGRTKPLD